jgi:acyl-CoA-dependent ceramide synthase
LPSYPNPFRSFVKISYSMPVTPEDLAHAPAAEARPLAKIVDEARYGKGPLDLCFLAFYVVVFSFIRQSSTEYFWRPLGRRLGIKGEKKLLRFMEQGYALEYFSVSGLLGVVRICLCVYNCTETIFG